MNKPGIYFVGAGPGDPGLITLRGANLLRRAGCVIYDGLVNPAVLEHCRPEAEKICVRKRTGSHSYTQDQVNELIVRKAGEYECVVRLKGGDPGMFGRAAEEIDACLQAGIGFEIVPGVTAAAAAAEYSGFFLTDRDASSQVIFVTGQEAPDKEESAIDWDLLAGFRGTIVFYMGMGNLERITQTLIENGKDGDTPVVVIQNATLTTQRIVQSRLEVIAEDCRRENIEAPAIVVIGRAAQIRPQAQWFLNKPLAGQHVLITRDEHGNVLFGHKLVEQGARVSFFDSIRSVGLIESPEVAEVLSRAAEFDWVVFTSRKGIMHTFRQLRRMKKDARLFKGVRIACIGSQTAGALLFHGIHADLVPQRYTSRGLAEALAEQEDLAGRKILLLRSAAAPNHLPDALRERGAQVTNVPVYTVVPNKVPTEMIEEISETIRNGQIDWITFTSSSTAESFFEQIDPEPVRSSAAKIISIGPVTTRALESIGMRIDLEAAEHTIDGIIKALIQHGHD